MSFFLTRSVAARVARFTYGTSCIVEFVPSDPQHALRYAQAFSQPSGRIMIPDAFDIILGKVLSFHVCNHDSSLLLFYREPRCARTRK